MFLVVLIAGLACLAALVLYLISAPTRKRRELINSAGLDSLKFFGKQLELFTSVPEIVSARNAPIKIIQLSKSGDKNWVWELFSCVVEGTKVHLFENKLTGFYKVFFTQGVISISLIDKMGDIGIFSKEFTSIFPGQKDERIQKVETRKNRYETNQNVYLSSTNISSNICENIDKLKQEHGIKWNVEISGDLAFFYRLNQFVSSKNLKMELENLVLFTDELSSILLDRE